MTGRTFLSCAKQNNSIISVQVCFAQLSKALLELIRLVNLEQCTTSLCAQEFAPCLIGCGTETLFLIIIIQILTISNLFL